MRLTAGDLLSATWMTWEDTSYRFLPMANQARWERRHTTNVTDRFTRGKTSSLQHGFVDAE